MKITDVDVIQSYLVTTARYDFSVYEKRILYRLVQLCQAQLQGQKLDKGFTINKDLFNGYWIRLPISSFLVDESDKNYCRVKNALKDLRNKVFEYEDEKRWELISIIESPIIEKYNEMVEFRVHPKIFNAILNFAKGFRRYELKTAMSFESVYAMRFYELLSGKKEAITYRIDQLKIMFKIEGKYKLTADFFRKVIEPAKSELDKHSPYSFEYMPIKEGRKIIKVKFYPVYNPSKRAPELELKDLEKQVSPVFKLDRIVVNYLKQNYYFDTKEINNNINVFIEAAEKLDLMLFLSEMLRKSSTKANPKGYLINAIKKKLSQL